MVETAEGRFDENAMPEKGGRVGANKHTANALFVSQSLGEGRRPKATASLRQQRNGVWQEEVVTDTYTHGKAVFLDGKVLPLRGFDYALKPGRRAWKASYRSAKDITRLYVSTRKGEIDGTVSAIDGNTITLSNSELDPQAGERTITLDDTARIVVDGKPGESGAIALGQYLRVFPARAEYCRLKEMDAQKFISV